MLKDSQARPVFLAPHYDDVALSCGGTVAALSDQGLRPVIVTCFGGEPEGPLTPFAAFQHRRWALDDDQVIQARQAEEREAATILGAESFWLPLPEAIYRDERYSTDEQLFGAPHPDDASIVPLLQAVLTAELQARGITPAWFAVPLGIGNHVDHQHVRAVGYALRRQGWAVWAYEDTPYVLSERGQLDIARAIAEHTAMPVWIQLLEEGHLQRRIDAIHRYTSQLAVIFRDVGDPVLAIRRYALEVGSGRLAERLWPLRHPGHAPTPASGEAGHRRTPRR